MTTDLPPLSSHLNLFIACSFYLVGFDSTADDENFDSNNIVGTFRKQRTKKAKKNREGLSSLPSFIVKDYEKIRRLIRRGLGTVYWAVHESITHVIVADGIQAKLRNDISNFCKYHPNNPVAVSPQWVVDCSKQSCLLDPNQYPPITMIEKKAAEIERKEVNVQQQKALSHNDNEAKNEISDQNTDYCETSSLLFQGAIFHLVHHSLSNKAENQQVTFDPKTIEKMIIKNGGHLLTEQVVNLIQHEEEIIHQRGHTGSNTNQSPTKTDVDFICYAINLNGPFNIQNSFNLSTLLSTIHQSKVCTIIPVTPIWMEACIANETVYQPDEYPTLFQPQTWPLTKIPSEIKIKVSVSGFQNSERSGLKHLLQSIGATYTDNMGNKNTHLICREAKGPKYHKAIEWGLHVVTVDWLYHIVQYGYYGRKDSDCDDYLNRGHEDDQYDHNIYSGSCCGCEKKFTLTFSPRRVQPLNRRIDDDSNIRPSKEFELKQKIIPSAK